MRWNFIIVIIVATSAVWVIGEDTSTVQTESKKSSTLPAHHYLKGRKAAIMTTATDDEGRVFAENFASLKTGFAKSLEKIRQKYRSIDEFLKDNPVIRKEIIVAIVLLTLIVASPIVVNWFYPA
ncbi:hypothetical protein CCR75_008870 [Bremia lactucae]|uniref:RxLR effector protein n=1 Tax=Bremia lactucae TaxID=4779 RepID=A0A976IAZ6_BRELC|nr:hypothetical protein CCR75_008870 [Bremia lactucae]